MKRPLSPPAPLTRAHDLSAFDCGVASLNNWLRNFGQRSEGKSARCFVVCDGKFVAGYHCISAGAIDRDTQAPEAMRKGMPASLPIMLIGRLAVDARWHGQGVGRGLLKDALRRILSASTEVGARAVIVHAIDDAAVAFYRQYGFKALPGESRSLYLPVEEIVAAIG